MNTEGIHEEKSAISLLREANDDLQQALMPVGFIEGLDRLMEDPPSPVKYAPLYFPSISYGAHWGVEKGW
jgi:hypothetical protein